MKHKVIESLGKVLDLYQSPHRKDELQIDWDNIPSFFDPLIGCLQVSIPFHAEGFPITDLENAQDFLKLPYNPTLLITKLRQAQLAVLAVQDNDGTIQLSFFEEFDESFPWMCGPIHAKLESLQDGNFQMSLALWDIFSSWSKRLPKGKWGILKEEYMIRTHTFLSFLEMLHCNNIETETIPAPAKLNKARKKKGRVPIDEYKILRIRKPDGTYERFNQGGSHNSPRLHHRRGHFAYRWKGKGRTRKKRTWVSPCMVGSSKDGVVEKEYSLL